MKLRLLVAIFTAILSAQAMTASPAVSRLEVIPAEAQPIPRDEASELMVKFWLQQLILPGL